MARSMAFFTGMLLALMVTFNGALSSATHAQYANIIFQGVGLLIFTLLILLLKKSIPWRELTLRYCFPGVLSAFAVLISSTVVQTLGVALMIGLSVVGQVAISMVIDQFGWFDRQVVSINKGQLGGFICILAGTLLMII